MEKQDSLKSRMANRLLSFEFSKRVVENKDKLPGPARPSLNPNSKHSKTNMAVGSEFQPVHARLSSRMNFIQRTQKIHSPPTIAAWFSLDESPKSCPSSTAAAHSALPSFGRFLLPS